MLSPQPQVGQRWAAPAATAGVRPKHLYALWSAWGAAPSAAAAGCRPATAAGRTCTVVLQAVVAAMVSSGVGGTAGGKEGACWWRLVVVLLRRRRHAVRFGSGKCFGSAASVGAAWNFRDAVH